MNRIMTAVIAVLLVQGFAATCAADTASTGFTISGYVRDCGGNPLAGVRVNLQELYDVVASVQTTAGGYYQFTVAGDRLYLVEPLRPGYTFLPAVRSYFQLTENQSDQHFVGNCSPNLTISGKVRDSSGNPLAGVSMALYAGGLSDRVQTQTNGDYQFGAVAGVSYEIIPSWPWCSFAPRSRAYSALSANQSAQDFVATCNAPTFTISGQVLDNSGNPVPGVAINVSGGAAQGVQTQASGNYQLSVTGSADYTSTHTVTPSRAGCTFVPATRSFANLRANQAGQDFGALCSANGVSPSYSFVPVAPCRVVDTRNGEGKTGLFGPPSLAGGSTREIPIPQGACNIPVSAKAYSLNFTVVPRGALAYLTTWAAGQPKPQVSTLNSFHGGVVANGALVPAGVNGGISVFVTETTDVIVDINGYFDTPNTANALDFYTLPQCRIADTRSGLGMFGPPSLLAGVARLFPILAGSCAVPASARAYSMNATVLPAGPLGYLTLYPAGAAQPLVSTLNSMDGAMAANAAIVPGGNGGAVNAFVTDRTDLLLDLNGYFGPPSTGSLKFYPTTPCRMADTRNGQGPAVTAGTIRQFAVGGVCGIPATAQAVSLNVTVVPSGPLDYLTLWPAGQPQPVASTLNSPRGRVLANAAIVQPGVNGAVSVFVTNTTHLILDCNGYFAP